MDFSQAADWSRQKNISLSHGVLLSNVPIDTSEETIARVLNTVKVFGRTKICGRHGDSTGTQLFILVETSIDLTSDRCRY